MADPLSIIQAVFSVSNQLYTIARSIKGAPAEMKALECEISRVHPILDHLLDTLTKQDHSGTRTHSDREMLQGLFNEARDITESANCFLNKITTRSSDGTIKVRKLQWICEMSSCKTLATRFHDLYVSISVVYSVLSNHHLPRTDQELVEPRQVGNGLLNLSKDMSIQLSMLRELQDDVRDSGIKSATLIRDVEAHLIRQNEHSRHITALCYTLVHAMMQSAADCQKRDVNQHYDQVTTDPNANPASSCTSYLAGDPGESSQADLLGITDRTSMSPTVTVSDRCSPNCCCKCHQSAISVLPWWLSPLIGRLSFQYDRLAALASARVQCNDTQCKRHRSDLLQIKYCCPNWFAQINAEIRSETIPVQFCIRTPRVVKSLDWLLDAAYMDVKAKLRSRELTVNDVDSEGYSVMHAVTTRVISNPSKNAHSILALLLEHSAPLEWQWAGLTPIENAVRVLFYYWNRHASHNAALTAVKSSLRSCLYEDVEHIWQNIADKMRWTPLHRHICALSPKYHSPSSPYFIPSDFIPQVNTEDRLGWTPLLYAMLDGQLDQMDALFHAGANPRIDTQIVEWAVRSGRAIAIGRLIRAGACDAFIRTALHYIADGGSNCCPSPFTITLALIRHAGHILNWDAQDIDEVTPLGCARMRMEEGLDDEEFKRVFELYQTRQLPDGAQYISVQRITEGLPLHEDYSGLPPTSLIRAGLRGDIAVIGHLIRLDAMVNERSPDGFTLLHLAALGRLPAGYRVALELVRHGGWGVDWTAKTPGDGKTALQIVTGRLKAGKLMVEERQEAEKIQELLRAERLPPGEQYLWPCMDPIFYEEEPSMPGAWVGY